MGTASDFLAFTHNKVVRLWKYKRMFTPYEQEKKFVDQSEYVDDLCEKVFILEVYDICGVPVIDYCPTDLAHFSDDGDLVASVHCLARLQDVELSIMEADTAKFEKGERDFWE